MGDVVDEPYDGRSYTVAVADDFTSSDSIIENASFITCGAGHVALD